MGCTSPSGCNSGCKSPLIPHHIPPEDGWILEGWPKFVPDAFREKYESTYGEAVWHGYNIADTLGQLNQVLNNNPEIPAYTRDEVCEWARAQWCENAPNRCKANTAPLQASKQKQSHNVSEPMDWAPEFWRTWNVAVSDYDKGDEEAGCLMNNFVQIAVSMLSGSYGCADCLDHFLLFVRDHPVERIHSFKHARVWLWRAHNQSKSDISGNVPVPYGVIASIYDWELLTDQEVLEVISELMA